MNFVALASLALVAGVVSFTSPCALPLLPGYVSYLSSLAPPAAVPVAVGGRPPAAVRVVMGVGIATGSWTRLMIGVLTFYAQFDWPPT